MALVAVVDWLGMVAWARRSRPGAGLTVSGDLVVVPETLPRGLALCQEARVPEADGEIPPLVHTRGQVEGV